MNKDENILLAKWLEGNITSEELKQLQQEVDLPTLNQVLNRQKNFELEVRSTEDMWADFEKRQPQKSEQHKNTKSPKKTPSNNRPWLLVFLFATALATGIWFFFNQKPATKKTKTSPAKTETIIYADGTKVHISPNSSVEYDETNWASKREIRLDGQAFFEVEKGSPFRVITQQGIVEVYGTQFDIWEMGDLMRVQCFEGTIKVSSGGQSKELKQNQKIFIDKSALQKIENIVSSQPDWMQSQRIYQKMPLRWVLKDLERFYDIKTNTTAVSIADNFAGVIPTNDLTKALTYLTKTVNWNYEIKDKTIYFTAIKE